jgi:hypothetical protein
MTSVEEDPSDISNEGKNEEDEEPIKSEDVKMVIRKIGSLNIENQAYREKINENKEIMEKLKGHILTYMKQQTKATGLEYGSITLEGITVKMGGKQRERKKKNERKESILKVIQEDVLDKDKKVDMDELFEKLEEARKGEEKEVESLKIKFPKKKKEEDDCV